MKRPMNVYIKTKRGCATNISCPSSVLLVRTSAAARSRVKNSKRPPVRTEQSRSLCCRFPLTSPPPVFSSVPTPPTAPPSLHHSPPQNVSAWLLMLLPLSLSLSPNLQGPFGASGAKGDMVNIPESGWSS